MRIWKLYFIALKNENKNTSLIIVPLKEFEASYIADQKFTLVKFYSPFFSGNGEVHEYKFEPKMNKY